MMFGGFIEPTPKNGIAWRVFEAVMGLRKQRDQWRECAASLLVYAEYLLTRIPDKREINWTVLEQARSMFKGAK